MGEWQTHSDYAVGYWDALDGEPLFPDASAPYAAGWHAATESREMLLAHGFTETSSGQFGKRIVLPPPPKETA